MPRLKIKLTKPSNDVSFDYQYQLLGFIHKVFGNNDFHDESLSLYNFSWIQNLQMNSQKSGLTASKYEPFFYLSAYSIDMINRFIANVARKNYVFSGMEVIDIEPVELNTSKNIYVAKSPIFLREYKTHKYLYFDDVSASLRMKDLLVKKLDKIGKLEEFELKFCNKKGAKIKAVKIKGITVKANVCPIYIEASKSTKRIMLEVGLGNSTGAGFGCVM